MRKILNSRGLTLVEVLAAVALISIVAVGVTALAQRVSTVNVQVEALHAANNIRTGVIETLSSSQAWKRTIAENPTAFSCLINDTDCRGVTGRSFKVWDADDTQPLVDTSPDAGFNLAAMPCTGYSASGSFECPFKLDVTWSAVCPPLPNECKNPQVQINADMKFSPSASLARSVGMLNAKNYSFSFIRGQTHNSLEGACAALQGTFDSATMTCRLKLAKRCAGGSVVTGITPDNDIICGFAVPAFACPAGNVLIGIAGDGTPECMPKICAPCDNNPGMSCNPLPPWEPGSDGGDGNCDGVDGDDGQDGCDGQI